MQDFKYQMRAKVDKSRVLSHPFHKVVASPSLSARRLIKAWASEDYWVSRQFPSMIGALVAETGDPKIRAILVRNLWDECGQGEEALSHFREYERLLDSIEASPSSSPSSEIQRFLALHRATAKESTLAALVMFCYANEYLCQFEFHSISKGIRLNFEDADVKYLDQIEVIEEHHTAELESAIDLLLSTSSKDELRRASELLDDALEVRAKLYDRILQKNSEETAQSLAV